jgi:hypothetical protein
LQFTITDNIPYKRKAFALSKIFKLMKTMTTKTKKRIWTKMIFMKMIIMMIEVIVVLSIIQYIPTTEGISTVHHEFLLPQPLPENRPHSMSPKLCNARAKHALKIIDEVRQVRRNRKSKFNSVTSSSGSGTALESTSSLSSFMITPSSWNDLFDKQHSPLKKENNVDSNMMDVETYLQREALKLRASMETSMNVIGEASIHVEEEDMLTRSQFRSWSRPQSRLNCDQTDTTLNRSSMSSHSLDGATTLLTRKETDVDVVVVVMDDLIQGNKVEKVSGMTISKVAKTFENKKQGSNGRRNIGHGKKHLGEGDGNRPGGGGGARDVSSQRLGSGNRGDSSVSKGGTFALGKQTSNNMARQGRSSPQPKGEERRLSSSVIPHSTVTKRHVERRNDMTDALVDRVSHDEEIELSRIIQLGVELHNLKSKFEQEHGREITRQEWAELAQLESPKQLRRMVSDYRKAKNKLVMANMGLVHAVVRSRMGIKGGSGKDVIISKTGISYEEMVQ